MKATVRWVAFESKFARFMFGSLYPTPFILTVPDIPANSIPDPRVTMLLPFPICSMPCSSIVLFKISAYKYIVSWSWSAYSAAWNSKWLALQQLPYFLILFFFTLLNTIVRWQLHPFDNIFLESRVLISLNGRGHNHHRPHECSLRFFVSAIWILTPVDPDSDNFSRRWSLFWKKVLILKSINRLR